MVSLRPEKYFFQHMNVSLAQNDLICPDGMKRDIPTEAVMVVPSAFEGLSGFIAIALICST